MFVRRLPFGHVPICDQHVYTSHASTPLKEEYNVNRRLLYSLDACTRFIYGCN